MLYEQEMASEGYEIVLACDGKEAVEKAQSVKPDCIIMDISMPGMDGIEAMGRILGANNKIPVIINTAYASYKDNFMSWSADAYVIKSSDLTELRKTIGEILAKKKAN
jgi:CheY-like chemotaxis protein